MTAKPGRNDACWCGSGKKYKKCHLDADESAARAHAKALAEARKDVALSEGAPEGVTVRAVEPAKDDPQEAADARFDLAWASADLDARVALIRAAIDGPDPASAERIFEAVAECAEDLRAKGRTRDLDDLLTAITTRRADCIDLDGGFYDTLAVENALLRGDAVGDLFRARARGILDDPAALGLVELLAFRGEDALLLEYLPAVLPALGDDDEEDEGEEGDAPDAPDAPGASEHADDDEEDFARSRQVLLEDIAFLVADLTLAREAEADPEIASHAEALRAKIDALIPVEELWFERVLRRHTGVDTSPLTEKDFASEEEGHVEDVTILATHDFFRWLRARAEWPLARAVLARMCLADMLLHHLESLRRISRRSLLVPAQTLLRYASDGEHPASSVALLLAGAWWTAWLVETGWADPTEASRELRLLKREWPAMVGTAGTPGGDPALSEALQGFWATFPPALLDPRGSITPPRAP